MTDLAVALVEDGTREDAQGRSWVGGTYGKWGRPQFLALLANTGTRAEARRLASTFITWKKGVVPPDYIFDLWAQEYEQGLAEPDPQDVARMKRRMLANEEWQNRASIRRARELKAKLADVFEKKIQNGETIGEDRVLWKYAADDIGFNTTAVSQAYGAPKQQAMQVGNLIINAGEKPPPRRLKAPRPKLIEQEKQKIIEGEFTEVGDAGTG